jgi:glutamine synthetase
VSAADVLEQLRAGELDTVIVGGCDTNGVFRAKWVTAEKFLRRLESGFELSEYVWGLDIADEAQPPPPGLEDVWPWWAKGFGDIDAVADLATLRRVPWLERTALALCDYRYIDGRDYDFAPRSVLRRVVERYERLGLEPRLAAEYEFIVFRETEESALAKGFRNLEPLSARAMPYGALQGARDSSLIGPIADALRALGVPVDTWNPEGAPGQYELNIAHAGALEAADQAFLFKHAVKELCALQGCTATFMPKLAAGEFGSSLHVHQSLWRHGAPAFYSEDDPDHFSPLLRHFIAGQLQTLVPFTPIWLPTPASYKRLGPYSAAGTTASWGGDNKTLSLRALSSRPAYARVEHRIAGADANVYLAFAAMLAGGLYGIEHELEPPAATTGDAYADPTLAQVPRTLHDALPAFEASAVAAEYLGTSFVPRYAATRRWEVEQAQIDITDWELRRYFVRA